MSKIRGGILIMLIFALCASTLLCGTAAVRAEGPGGSDRYNAVFEQNGGGDGNVQAVFEDGADDGAPGTVTGMPDPINGQRGEVYDIPEREPARDGYKFDGWIVKGTDGPVYRRGGENGSFTMPESGIIFVAQWSENHDMPEPTSQPTINPGTEPTTEPTSQPTINPGTVPTEQPQHTIPPTTSEPQQPTNPPATSEPQQPTNPPATSAPQEPTNPPTTSEPQQPTNPPATATPIPAETTTPEPEVSASPSPTKRPGGSGGGGFGGGTFGTGGTTSIRVVKEWEDDNDSRGERPESITVKLLQNGTAIDQCVLSAENNWQHTFSSLRNGAEYTVAEEEVKHYTPQYVSSFGGYRIINRYDESAAADQINDRHPEAPTLNYDDHYAYIVGYEDGTVRPEGTITRAEVATIFFRMLSDNSRDRYYSKTNDFDDVSAGDWFNTAVSTMASADIIHGYEDGTFRGDDPITRAEFAVIAANFDSSAYDGPDKFSDVSGHWASEYINRAAEHGWINGYEDGTFRPDQNITRAEATALVNRVLNRKPSAGHMLDDMTVWPDNNKNEWYYADIQEATNSHYSERSNDGYEIWTSLRPVIDWKALET